MSRNGRFVPWQRGEEKDETEKGNRAHTPVTEITLLDFTSSYRVCWVIDTASVEEGIL